MAHETVTFNGGAGKENQVALTVKVLEGGNRNLAVYDDDGGTWTTENDVPERAPADYGPEGGGRTWHH